MGGVLVLLARLIGIGGLVLFFWALGSGFATDKYSRARVFLGPLGFLFNIVCLLVGGILSLFGLTAFLVPG
jgi:hypothetical protein